MTRRRGCLHSQKRCCLTCKRRKNRDRMRRVHEYELEQRQQARARCPRRFGAGECRELLRVTTDGAGRVVVSCDKCDRLKQGICRDCPARVEGMVGRALRCARCKIAAFDRQQRESKERHRDELRHKARERAQRPHNRKRNIEYKRAWRMAHPEQVKAQKRRFGLRQPAHYYEYLREYRRTHGDRRCQRGTRHCIAGCGTIVTGRRKKCDPCRAIALELGVALLRGRAA